MAVLLLHLATSPCIDAYINTNRHSSRHHTRPILAPQVQRRMISNDPTSYVPPQQHNIKGGCATDEETLMPVEVAVETTGTLETTGVESQSPFLFSRRRIIDSSISTVVTASLLTATITSPSRAEMVTVAGTQTTQTVDPLEQILLGDGTWKPFTSSITTPEETMSRVQQPNNPTTTTTTTCITPSFVTYMTRFLIRFDPGVNQWWSELVQTYSLLSVAERDDKLTQKFAALAKSLQQGLLATTMTMTSGVTTTTTTTTTTHSKYFQHLWDLMVHRYGSQQTDAIRQISLLFALLPPVCQPLTKLKSVLPSNRQERQQQQEQLRNIRTTTRTTATTTEPTLDQNDSFWDSYFSDLTALLPREYHCQLSADGMSIHIVPRLPLSLQQELEGTSNKLIYDNNDDEDVEVDRTLFGPMATSPLMREIPTYSPLIYTLLGVSGATGCALTHAIVIPLDVVKTRAQTNPVVIDNGEATTITITGRGSNGNMVTAAFDIVQNEGIDALLLGAQATIAGYSWYGLSVYPSYTFFKRFLTLEILPPEVAMVHTNDIALIAGAMAAVVASIGLTPIEAARIRVVAEPETYRPLGLLGTLQFIAREDAAPGWQALYAGFPSLLTRQVIFGSVKFLAFERACEFIFAAWPFLRESTWTGLAVSLVAGAFSGALSSVVSQPADSLLTFVAQNNNNNAAGVEGGGGGASMGLLEGCRIMIEQEGPASLFRGLGSRCVWAGSIIAGQFLLYDIFRTFFQISTTDLSQVYQLVVELPNVK